MSFLNSRLIYSILYSILSLENLLDISNSAYPKLLTILPRHALSIYSLPYLSFLATSLLRLKALESSLTSLFLFYLLENHAGMI